MGKKNITIKELADILNVSISTVSKALNDSHEIGDKTKTKVKEIAALYNYRPNFIAKSLKDRTTKTIGVVVPDILNYFFVKVLYGIEKEARDRGYKVITCISHESLEIEVENITTLTNGRVDGLLICPSEETQQTKNNGHIKELIDSNIPVVTFDRTINALQCASVVSDDLDAARNATNHLISKGCKSIALFSAHEDLSVMKERIIGYQKAMQDHNSYNEANIFSFDDVEHAEDRITEILKNHSFDAVLTIDELLSVKTIKMAQQLKIAIPRDFKVIGFSNGQISKEFYPSVSSVDQHAEEMGALAASLLIDSIRNPDDIKIESKIVKSSLVERDSSRI
jgi:LacI family transcriptional regulator